MILLHDIEIDDKNIQKELRRLINLTYKLLPSREENIDWKKPLETIIEEIAGMDRLFIDHQDILFPLLCKLEGLFILTEPKDFGLFRRVIFECLNIMNTLQNKICQE